MATLQEDIQKSYEWIVEAFVSLSKSLDFSVESLQDIDEFISEQSSDGRPKDGSILAQDLGGIIFSLGCYVGEVLRRQVSDAIWFTDDNDPKGEMNIEVRFPNNGKVWPVQKVMKRLKNGPQDSLLAYGKAIVNDYSRP